MSKKMDEKFVVLRFTEKADLKEFYGLLEDSGFIQKLKSTSTEDPNGETREEREEERNSGKWDEWGADYEDENVDGVNDMRVGGA